MLPLNAPKSGTLNPGNATALYQFNGQAGQRLIFTSPGSAGTNYSVNYYLYGPNDHQDGGGNYSYLGDDGEVTLPANGTYLLALAGNSSSPVPYTVEAVTPVHNTAALKLGKSVNGSLTGPGQIDDYTFTGSAGQRLYFNSLLADYSLTVDLTDPTGQSVFSTDIGSNDGPVTLTADGTYRLTISASGGSTGSYSFQLLDGTAAPVLPLNTPVSGTLNPGNATALYRFNGSAGQRLLFTWPSSSSGSNGSYYLYAPDNTQILNPYSNNFGTTEDVTLSANGAYLLALAGSGSSPVPYTIKAVTPVHHTAALTLGKTVSGSLTGPGQIDDYTFSGSAGQRLYFSGQGNDYFAIATLTGPSGQSVLNGTYTSSNSGPMTLPQDGTYRLSITGVSSTSTGNYHFQILDLAAAKPLTLGTLVKDTLTPGTSINLYQFSGAAGQGKRVKTCPAYQRLGKVVKTVRDSPAFLLAP
jgi:hypothetical protein